MRWSTLQGYPGPARLALADEVLSELLRFGFAEIEQRRDEGRWLPTWVRLLNVDVLRGIAGLPDTGALEDELRSLQAVQLATAALRVASTKVAGTPVLIAIRRLRLLHHLDRWAQNGRRGTRRDFALAASGNTKGIQGADWNWLDDVIDLEELGVDRHVPLVLLRAPLTIVAGSTLDLRAIPDCVGLSPMLLASATGITGAVGTWRLVENRTLFDRITQEYGANDGVVWIPGFPPAWWRTALQQLVSAAPAPARIACDPDPAGILIALEVASTFDRLGLDWSPWGMDPRALATLPAHRPLTDDDRKLLQQILVANVSEPFQAAAHWMLEHGLKGEQEGLSPTHLRS